MDAVAASDLRAVAAAAVVARTQRGMQLQQMQQPSMQMPDEPSDNDESDNLEEHRPDILFNPIEASARAHSSLSVR